MRDKLDLDGATGMVVKHCMAMKLFKAANPLHA